MAIIGIARGFHIDITPYLNSYGRQLYSTLQNASIVNVLGQYPGLTFARLVKPRYANPASIPLLVKVENELNTGSLPPRPFPCSSAREQTAFWKALPATSRASGLAME